LIRRRLVRPSSSHWRSLGLRPPPAAVLDTAHVAAMGRPGRRTMGPHKSPV
jgi:hypothetical protein